MEAGHDIGTKLVEQRVEFEHVLLGDQPLEPRHLPSVVFFAGDHTGQIEARQRAQIERNHVPAERRRRDMMHHERGNAMDVLECLDAMGDRVLLGMVERKAVGRLKHALQHAAKRQRRPRWIW